MNISDLVDMNDDLYQSLCKQAQIGGAATIDELIEVVVHVGEVIDYLARKESVGKADTTKAV